MTPKRRWVIGSAADCDVVVQDRDVAPHHCRLFRTPRGFVLEDLGAVGGTYVNGERVQFRARVRPADRITLGLRVPMPWPSARPAAPAADPSVLRIGRAVDNDLVLDYPVISPYHARVVLAAGRAWIEDLNSVHGIALGNPQRKVSRAPLAPSDLVYLGWLPVPAARILRHYGRGRAKPQAAVIPVAPNPGEVTVQARRVAVDAGQRRLLQDVSLTIFPGELVGIMGPSGAGKTTLLRTLNGYTPPAAGEVLYNGKDLYAHYRQLSGRLGYVPQDDILHHELTVREVLAYGARLRLPSSCPSALLKERLAEVVQQLGLKGTEDTPIGAPGQRGISGGQRKRVNLALELLTNPLVLFLDEPTSGLSSEEALVVMRLLRELADSGKTVILTLHQPSRDAFRLLDNLVLLARDANSVQPGKLVYYGPAYPDALHYFANRSGAQSESVPDPDAMLRDLATGKTEEWAQEYADSSYQREYVLERGKRQPLPPLPEENGRTPGALAQWWTLVRRSLAIKRRSTMNTAILLVQAPAIAVLIVLVYGKQASAVVHENNWGDVATAVAISLFLQLLAAVWFGCSNAVREIVGEWAVYQRERMVNLKLTSYLGAKLTVLGGLCLIQCVVLLGVVHWGCCLKAPWLLFGYSMLTALVGVALGLLISAIARNSSAAVSLLPVLLLLMVILGGAMQPVHRMTDTARVICSVVPSRWAFEGMLLVESEHQPPFRPSPSTIPPYAGFPKERLREQDIAEYYFPQAEQRSSGAMSGGALAAIFCVSLLALLLVLRLRDVH